MIRLIPTTVFRCLTSPQNGNRVVFTRRSHIKADNSTSFEITNGVGGVEAMLFASEMLNVYINYFELRKWHYKLLEEDKADIGGIRSAKLIINSAGAFEELVQEAGVHRVQRIPVTERKGRMHTSTITISLVPQFVLDVKINDRDLEIQTMRSSGPGGQHVNKTESAIRIIHKPTGIASECQETRSQMENRKAAMAKLLKRLQDIEMEKVTSNALKLKKTQIGSANRNEKIRTYNFPADRITDHRILKNYHGLKRLIGGDSTILEKIIKDFHN